MSFLSCVTVSPTTSDHSPPIDRAEPLPLSLGRSKGNGVTGNNSLDTKRLPRMQSLESTTSGAATLAGSREAVNTPPFYRRQNGILSPTTTGSYPGIGIPQDPSVPGSQSEKDLPNRFGVLTMDVNARKKKLPNIRSYFISRELLMTERTYNRDLSIICTHFKSAVSQLRNYNEITVLEELFSALQPLVEFHKGFLAELEQKLSAWEDDSEEQWSDTKQHRIGDSLLCAVHNSLHHYKHYLSHLAIFLASIDQLYKRRKDFESRIRDFQESKTCYLPLNQILLKPAHRIAVWQQILARLISYYVEVGADHADLNDSRVAMEKIASIGLEMKSRIENFENFAKLVELERDLVGVDNLVEPNRIFLREGSLQRFSKKGPVQRIFMLFNDCLIYANRSSGTNTIGQHLSFRLHGQIPLRGLMLEEGDRFRVTSGLANCFTIYGANRSLIVSAGSQEEKRTWIEDISKAVMMAKETNKDTLPEANTLKSLNSTDDVGSETVGSLEEIGGGASSVLSGATTRGSPGLDRQLQQKANNSLHVCWHRSTTLSKDDLHKAGRNLHSGYLLRKFRNSTGWQKLWVVYGHFCLFFFKSHADDSSLASLPLLGYQVGQPGAEDGIHKDHVFKLYYKSHYYYFRADSEYSFNRWLEVIRSACCSPVPPSPKSVVPVLPE